MVVVEVELEIAAGRLGVVGRLAVVAGCTAKAFHLSAAAAASTDWTGGQHEKCLTAAAATFAAGKPVYFFAVDSVQTESWQHLDFEYFAAAVAVAR